MCLTSAHLHPAAWPVPAAVGNSKWLCDRAAAWWVYGLVGAAPGRGTVGQLRAGVCPGVSAGAVQAKGGEAWRPCSGQVAGQLRSPWNKASPWCVGGLVGLGSGPDDGESPALDPVGELGCLQWVGQSLGQGPYPTLLGSNTTRIGAAGEHIREPLHCQARTSTHPPQPPHLYQHAACVIHGQISAWPEAQITAVASLGEDWHLTHLGRPTCALCQLTAWATCGQDMHRPPLPLGWRCWEHRSESCVVGRGALRINMQKLPAECEY